MDTNLSLDRKLHAHLPKVDKRMPKRFTMTDM